jgi:hypothetical protein
MQCIGGSKVCSNQTKTRRMRNMGESVQTFSDVVRSDPRRAAAGDGALIAAGGLGTNCGCAGPVLFCSCAGPVLFCSCAGPVLFCSCAGPVLLYNCSGGTGDDDCLYFRARDADEGALDTALPLLCAGSLCRLDLCKCSWTSARGRRGTSPGNALALACAKASSASHTAGFTRRSASAPCQTASCAAASSFSWPCTRATAQSRASNAAVGSGDMTAYKATSFFLRDGVTQQHHALARLSGALRLLRSLLVEKFSCISKKEADCEDWLLVQSESACPMIVASFCAGMHGSFRRLFGGRDRSMAARCESTMKASLTSPQTLRGISQLLQRGGCSRSGVRKSIPRDMNSGRVKHEAC